MSAPRLTNADLSLEVKEDHYHKRIKELQHELVDLQYRLAEAKVPVIFAFEGWDAAEKGRGDQAAGREPRSALVPRAHDLEADTGGTPPAPRLAPPW